MRRRAGFTLLEVLTTVLIIGVLAAVTLPVFSGAKGDTQAAVCAANRASLQSRMTVLEVKNRSLPAEQVQEKIQAELDEYACPSGGTYTVCLYGGQWTVLCSAHSETNPTIPLARTMRAKGYINASNVAAGSTRIDSTSPNGTRTLAIKAALDTDLAALNAKTWAAINIRYNGKNYYKLVWTSTEIENLSAGDQFAVMCLDMYTGAYSVWLSTVYKQSLTQDGATSYYNILALQSEISTSKSATAAQKLNYTYMNALYYQTINALAAG